MEVTGAVRPGSGSRLATLGLVLALGQAPGLPARADARGAATGAVAGSERSVPPIVLESYAGARPEDAEALLAPLHAELVARGYLSGPRLLGDLIEARLSHQARPLSAPQLAETKGLVVHGYDQWIAGDWPRAIVELSAAAQLLYEQPATLARDDSMRELALKAMIGLALSHKRLGHTGAATTVMAEIVRSFPDREISRLVFGPEPAELYRAVAAQLRQGGEGQLRVQVDDPTVVLFVNERYVGTGSVVMKGLVAGTYRVYLQRGQESGRVHAVEVRPGGEAVLDSSWALDGSLHTDSFVGFAHLAPRGQAGLEASQAGIVARAVGAETMVIVGIRPVRGRRSIVGMVFDRDSDRPLRSAALAVEPGVPSAKGIRTLAGFLAGQGAVGGLIVLADRDGGRSEGAAGPRRPLRVWKWAALGAGVLAIAAGVTLVAIDEPEVQHGAQQAVVRETMVPGLITGGAGAVLLGTGVFLWTRDRPRGSSSEVGLALVPGAAAEPGVALVPGGAALYVTGRF